MALGRQGDAFFVAKHDGNTPTSVGKTAGGAGFAALLEKHPHWRGEDDGSERQWTKPTETPPLAWGRPCSNNANSNICRNTPTGVGKTLWRRESALDRKKHLHWRGEGKVTSFILRLDVGSTPYW